MKGAFGGRRGIFHTGITGMGGTGGIMGTIGTAYGIMGICIGVLWAPPPRPRRPESVTVWVIASPDMAIAASRPL